MSLAAETLAARSRVAYVSPLDIAEYYAYSGNEGQTLDWLEKALDVREPNMPYIHLIPSFANMRNVPRFQDLLRQMNLPL